MPSAVVIRPGKAKTIRKIRRYQRDIGIGCTNPEAKRLREYRRQRRLRNRREVNPAP